MANKGRKRVRKMDHIPHDIVVDIFSYLPVKSLLRFKCISKQCYVLITNPDFTEQHLLKQQEKDLQILVACPRLLKHIVMNSMLTKGEYVVGAGKVICNSWVTIHDLPDDYYFMSHSCDGILCFHGYLYIHLYNPSTREFRTLPQGSFSSLSYHIPANCLVYSDAGYALAGEHYRANQLVGFGRDLVTKEYKILRLFTPIYSHFQDFNECEIFTLNPDPRASWKSIGLVPYKIAILQRSVCVKGVIYLLTDENFHESEVIVMFDLHLEKFQAIAHPKCCSNPSQPRSPKSLVSLRGCLCLAEQTCDSQLNIWIMTHIYASLDKTTVIWEKLCSTNLLLMDFGMSFSFSIAEHNDGTILMCGCKDKLYLYHQNSKSFSYVNYGTGGQYMTTTFIESFVPLYGTRLPSFY